MEKYSVHEIIEQAVQTERLGYDFYTHMGKKFEKELKLKELFDTLAVKERQHEKRFNDLKKAVPEQDIENPGEVAAYLRAVVESEFFLGRNKSLPSLERFSAGDDAARFALGFERETLLYYYGLRDIIGENAILREIINEEKSHIRWLSEYRKAGK